MLSLDEALSELDRRAPHASLLALGQTVFWDEPMKAGVAIAAAERQLPRKLVAGIHDTDYFAKLPSGARKKGAFKAFPHNDTSTRGLWSAAAEFSALLGSETVVTREALHTAGLRLEKISKGRPHLLDQATEAWGWRGIVSLDDDAPLTSEVRLEALFPELKSTLDWAIDLTLSSVCETQKLVSSERADHLRAIAQETYDANPGATLADYYKALLSKLYSFVAGEQVELEETKTTELLKFNKKTCSQARFDLVNLFVSPESADIARQAYNEAIKGSEIYGLDRFGTGAIPFDLVIPGKGRGTLRIGPKAIVVMTHEPQFITLTKPLRHIQDLASAICEKLGEDCVLIGKAVTLIGMLAREFVFVFHEGASSYIKHTRKMHEILQAEGHGLKMNPILRINLDAWGALQGCNTWLQLPEPFQGPFGTEDVAAQSFAARWRDVAEEQAAMLDQLSKLKRPLDLIQFLEVRAGGSWHCLACEYGHLHDKLEQVEREIAQIKGRRRECYNELRGLKKQRVEAERKMGDHFRANLFGKTETPEHLRERAKLGSDLETAIHAITAKKREIRDLLKEESDFVRRPEIQTIHERRRAIELEAELKRLRLIREAVITSKGLAKASHRPSAWWFPILCPDGGWFRACIDDARCYLEAVGPD
jgi:hypothetical protein